MKHFSEEDVRQLLPMKHAVRCMREAFLAYGRGEAQNQPRRRLRLPNGSTLHSLAGAYGRYFGTKVYSTNPKHGAWFTVLLYDADTGRPLAQFEANYLGQIRTGAASGLATDLLAPQDAATLGVIGSGFQARSQVEAIQTVRPIRFIRVWSRNDDKRRQFAEDISARLSIPVEAVRTANEVLEGIQILVTATFAKDPVFDAAAVKAPLLINAMGSNQKDRAEIPAGTVREASLLVADDVEQCRIEAGDFVRALDDAGWGRVASLGQLLDAEDKGIPAATTGGVTIFKSVGLGLEDVAAAAYVYEKAAAS